MLPGPVKSISEVSESVGVDRMPIRSLSLDGTRREPPIAAKVALGRLNGHMPLIKLGLFRGSAADAEPISRKGFRFRKSSLMCPTAFSVIALPRGRPILATQRKIVSGRSPID
jgi:hypothetical protein